MSVEGIDEVTFGATDLEACKRFFGDWGLTLLSESAQELVCESLNGCRVIAARSDKPGLPAGIEADPTLREVVWGVESRADLDAIRERIRHQPGFVDGAERIGCTDPNGLAVRVQVSRKRPVDIVGGKTNTWSERVRINQPAPAYDRATPVEVGHVVFFVKDLAAMTAFYEQCLGFVVSDRYPNRGHFMRCAPNGGHHDLFLLETPDKRVGLNHVAFTVRDGGSFSIASLDVAGGGSRWRQAHDVRRVR